MLLLTIGLVLFVICACVVLAVAIVIGSQLERRVALACLIAIVATQLASLLGPFWRGPEYGVMLVDAAFAAWLSIIACRSTRWWPILAASAQIDGTLMHFAPIVVRDVPDTVYLGVQTIWGVIVLIALLWGVISHCRTKMMSEREMHSF